MATKSANVKLLQESSVGAATDRRAESETGKASENTLVRPSQCYFQDGGQELLNITNPRYLCLNDLPSTCVAGLETLGAKFLSDSVLFKPHGSLPDAEVRGGKAMPQIKAFNGILKARAKLIAFALKQKLKYTSSDEQSSAVLKSVDSLIARLTVKNANELQQELWFEGELKKVQPAQAVFDNETSSIFATKHAALSDVAFQLSTAIIVNNPDLKGSSKSQGTFGLARDLAQTIHFTLNNDMKTLQFMHFPVDDTDVVNEGDDLAWVQEDDEREVEQLRSDDPAALIRLLLAGYKSDSLSQPGSMRMAPTFSPNVTMYKALAGADVAFVTMLAKPADKVERVSLQALIDDKPVELRSGEESDAFALSATGVEVDSSGRIAGSLPGTEVFLLVRNTASNTTKAYSILVTKDAHVFASPTPKSNKNATTYEKAVSAAELRTFFSRHDPTRLPFIDLYLRKYAGAPPELALALKAEFGEAPELTWTPEVAEKKRKEAAEKAAAEERKAKIKAAVQAASTAAANASSAASAVDADAKNASEALSKYNVAHFGLTDQLQKALKSVRKHAAAASEAAQQASLAQTTSTAEGNATQAIKEANAAAELAAEAEEILSKVHALAKDMEQKSLTITNATEHVKEAKAASDTAAAASTDAERAAVRLGDDNAVWKSKEAAKSASLSRDAAKAAENALGEATAATDSAGARKAAAEVATQLTIAKAKAEAAKSAAKAVAEMARKFDEQEKAKILEAVERVVKSCKAASAAAKAAEATVSDIHASCQGGDFAKACATQQLQKQLQMLKQSAESMREQAGVIDIDPMRQQVRSSNTSTAAFSLVRKVETTARKVSDSADAFQNAHAQFLQMRKEAAKFEEERGNALKLLQEVASSVNTAATHVHEKASAARASVRELRKLLKSTADEERGTTQLVSEDPMISHALEQLESNDETTHDAKATVAEYVAIARKMQASDTDHKFEDLVTKAADASKSSTTAVASADKTAGELSKVVEGSRKEAVAVIAKAKAAAKEKASKAEAKKEAAEKKKAAAEAAREKEEKKTAAEKETKAKEAAAEKAEKAKKAAEEKTAKAKVKQEADEKKKAAEEKVQKKKEKESAAEKEAKAKAETAATEKREKTAEADEKAQAAKEKGEKAKGAEAKEKAKVKLEAAEKKKAVEQKAEEAATKKREKVEAEEKAKKAKVAAEERAKREKVEAEEKAKRDKAEAEEKAKRDKADAATEKTDKAAAAEKAKEEKAAQAAKEKEDKATAAAKKKRAEADARKKAALEAKKKLDEARGKCKNAVKDASAALSKAQDHAKAAKAIADQFDAAKNAAQAAQKAVTRAMKAVDAVKLAVKPSEESDADLGTLSAAADAAAKALKKAKAASSLAAVALKEARKVERNVRADATLIEEAGRKAERMAEEARTSAEAADEHASAAAKVAKLYAGAKATARLAASWAGQARSAARKAEKAVEMTKRAGTADAAQAASARTSKALQEAQEFAEKAGRARKDADEIMQSELDQREKAREEARKVREAMSAKEGAADGDTDEQSRLSPTMLAARLRLRSSKLPASQRTSLADYISRAKAAGGAGKAAEGKILYVVSPGIASAEQTELGHSDFMRSKQVASATPHEVLFVESEENLYLLELVQQFDGFAFVSLGAAEVEGENAAGVGGHGAEATFQQWLTDTIRAAGQTEGGTKIESAGTGAKVDAGVVLEEGKLRFDMAHPLVQQLSAQRALAPDVASAVAAQMFDNARLVAGVLPDSRTMLPRLNQMLEGILSDEDDADELDDLD